MKIKQDKTGQEVFRDENFIQRDDKFAIRKKTHTIFLCVRNPHNLTNGRQFLMRLDRRIKN